jgi:hypothetical protein
MLFQESTTQQAGHQIDALIFEVTVEGDDHALVFKTPEEMKKLMNLPISDFHEEG